MPATSSVDRRAVIDVGTNSVKLLVADLTANGTEPICELNEQTRLGQNFYPHHVLEPSAIQRTAAAVAAYAEIARLRQATQLRLIATSAARDAQNRSELARALEAAAGVPLEIISGEQEAHLAFQGVAQEPRFRDQHLAILDVGGGSTEIIYGRQETVYFHGSFPLGTVRFFELRKPSDPPTTAELANCREDLKRFGNENLVGPIQAAVPWQSRSQSIVGTGGTAAIVASMHAKLTGFDRKIIEATEIPRTAVTRLAQQLWSLPLAERRHIPGLPANRADVMLMGIVIYEMILELLEFDRLQVSTRGLRFAAVAG